jgi:hypothetical protein
MFAIEVTFMTVETIFCVTNIFIFVVNKETTSPHGLLELADAILFIHAAKLPLLKSLALNWETAP